MAPNSDPIQMLFRLSALKRRASSSSTWANSETDHYDPSLKLEIKPFQFPPLPTTPPPDSIPPDRKGVMRLCESNPEPLALRAARVALNDTNLGSTVKEEPVSELTSDMFVASDDVHSQITPPPRQPSGGLTGPSTRRLRATMSASRKGNDDALPVRRLFEDSLSEEKSNSSEEYCHSSDQEHKLEEVQQNTMELADGTAGRSQTALDLDKNYEEKGLQPEKIRLPNQASPAADSHPERQLSSEQTPPNKTIPVKAVRFSSEKQHMTEVSPDQQRFAASPQRRTSSRQSSRVANTKSERTRPKPASVSSPHVQAKKEEEVVAPKPSKKRKRRSGLQRELFGLQKAVAAAPWTDSKKIENQTDIIIISDDEAPSATARSQQQRKRQRSTSLSSAEGSHRDAKENSAEVWNRTNVKAYATSNKTGRMSMSRHGVPKKRHMSEGRSDAKRRQFEKTIDEGLNADSSEKEDTNPDSDSAGNGNDDDVEEELVARGLGEPGVNEIAKSWVIEWRLEQEGFLSLKVDEAYEALKGPFWLERNVSKVVPEIAVYARPRAKEGEKPQSLRENRKAGLRSSDREKGSGNHASAEVGARRRSLRKR